MITQKIRFMQICVNSDHIFGLTEDGEVYYRDKPPYSYNTTTYYGGGNGAVKKDIDEEKKLWKKLAMDCVVPIPKGGEVREAQPAPDTNAANVVVDVPAHKVYRDTETVKKVQVALQGKGFYKGTNKIDGDLGNFTVTAIKEFQKSAQLIETGEIDLTLCNALGLNQPDVNETVVEPEVAEDSDVA